MGKALISWIAANNDFEKNSWRVNEKGPTANFYAKYYKGRGYDRHILLVSDQSDSLLERKGVELRSFLEKTRICPEVSLRNFSIQNPSLLHDVWVVLEPFINTLKDEKLEVIASSGTPAMFAAWTFLAAKYPQRITLLQMMDPRFSTDTEFGDLVPFVISDLPISILYGIKEQTLVARAIDFESFQEEALKRAKEIGQSNVKSILISGENGSGKTHIAKTIHDYSSRKDKLFKIIHSSAFTDELFLSELFGHEKGAFTGAGEAKDGAFKVCDKGTIFLDEIGDLSPFCQLSLLRAIENGEFYRVGGSHKEPTNVDVRVIAATNRNLLDMCEKGTFRWDLYYRLTVAEIQTKSINAFRNERKREMIQYFIEEEYENYKDVRQRPVTLSEEVWKALDAHAFPGNIREMKNVVQQFYTFPHADIIKSEHLPKRISTHASNNPEDLDSVISQHLHAMYKKYGSYQELHRITKWSVNTIKKYMNMKSKND